MLIKNFPLQKDPEKSNSRFLRLTRNLFDRLRGKRSPPVPLAHELPLRSELFSAEQMELHGSALAQRHVLGQSDGLDRLLLRLDDNEQCLNQARTLLIEAVKNKLQIAPAGEWLLDNFYLIDDQVRTARRHLPKDYSKELPRLAEGPSLGLPRVYDLSLEAISHGDGRVDEEALRLFVAAYQTVTPLLLGELWAIPIMLRLAMIENLRRVSMRVAAARAYVNQAQDWANQMLTVAETDPKNLIVIVADMARSNPPMASSFVAELARCLQGHGPELALPLTWIKQRLAESSLTIEQLVLSENQLQAADQVAISNTIASLRFLSAMDWREFVESMSLVEQVLCQDAGAVYPAMDFSTRDRYRHVIDRLSKRSPDYGSNLARTEIAVAQAAIDLAQSKAVQQSESKPGETNHTAHVGYYLVDQGLPALEATLAVPLSVVERMRRWMGRVPLFIYLGSMFLLTVTFTAALLIPQYRGGVTGWWIILLGCLVVLAVSQFGSVLVNWLVTMLLTPQLLPRMDYAHGLPSDQRTLVVITTMLGDAQGIANLLEALEVQFLGNRDSHLHFALLTDFCDAATETLPADEHLLSLAKRGIEKLNHKYKIGEPPRDVSESFFLFHRPRRWNPTEKMWMGYERKRGKLTELNGALRGGGWDRFCALVGNVEVLTNVRYIITLDTDTQLPRDVARQLVAAMAHPLNRARYDEPGRLVVGGYGILQPQMAASLSGANRSRYAQLCGNESGIDPYTRSVSDIYQDLFGEGSFIGKGIYDIDAFEYALKGRLPENRILSHDLLEGCYVRSGLLSDVHLYEEYPARYQADVKRQQRWIRGDWQIANWLLPRVPGVDGNSLRNPLSLLARWKILDNLRRSLIPAAYTLLLLVGWFLLAQPWRWTAVVAGLVLIPPLLVSIVDSLRRPRDMLFRHHLPIVLRSAKQSFALTIFRLACLPYEALTSLVAIVRTTWRVLVSHQQLLEWSIFNNESRERRQQGATARQPYASISNGNNDTIVAAFRSMWIAPLMAISVVTIGAMSGSHVVAAVLPFAALWLVAPLVCWWLSKPLVYDQNELSTDQLLFLRRIARKTWAFFDNFVTAKDHWLPPDNYQEDPGPVLAHRTSPTNIGLSLLANVSATDFGFISVGALLERSANTFASLDRLESYHGQFFNWYDTQTLQPLPPRYISSVDSGNLAGHLLTLSSALLELPTQEIISSRVFEGLVDTVELMQEAIDDVIKHADDSSPAIVNHNSPVHIDKPGVIQSDILQLCSLLKEAVDLQPLTLEAAACYLEKTVQAAAAIKLDFSWLDSETLATEVQRNVLPAALSSGIATETEAEAEAKAKAEIALQWLHAVGQQAQDMLDDLLLIAPWLNLQINKVPMEPTMAFSGIPTLEDLGTRLPEWLSILDEQCREDLSAVQRIALMERRRLLDKGLSQVAYRIEVAEMLARQAGDFAVMDYELLYDQSRHQLTVGYNVDEGRCDTSYYDLLASESRLANFVAIAQGKLPQESWFALSRLLTRADGESVLVSWSGSMFEYLMPLLVMPMYDSSLLDQSCRAAVAHQIAYGKQRGMPWGISESGYNILDASLNYQYHAFGVPGLGLKRGLAEESVVAPYASALALMVAPEQACQNLQLLSREGFEGRYGFYEAVDYTPERLAHNESHSIVRSFMAHHQGMILLSLEYLLLDRPMQRRFASNPALRATLLLLQERIPKASVLDTHVAERSEGEDFADVPDIPLHAPIAAQTPTPEVQLLSNGRYQVMVTNAGGGYSRWRNFAVTRWVEDSTCDNWGSFFYLRDIDTGSYWSAAHHPTCKPADSYAAMFSEGRAEYRRRDLGIETYTEIVVSPEDDIELRRVCLTNRSGTRKTIEITSYAEVVLATPEADAGQTAFSKLFVQTQILSRQRAILCSRRPRSVGEQTPWMFHLMATNGSTVSDVSFETDRTRFIGRGRTLTEPQAMVDTAALSGTDGSVLDPVVSIRGQVVLQPGQSATLDFIFGAAASRLECMSLIEHYQDRYLADRVFDLAGTHSGVILRQINASQLETQLYRRLASAVIYANAALRADEAILIQNRRGQSGLWGYAISGDLPIVLLKITDINCLDHARQLIQCHAYWRLKGLAVDLVIWNENHVGYRQELQDQIMGLIATGNDAHTIDRPGGIFVRFAEQISLEDRNLLQAVARVIIVDSAGSLMEQINRRTIANTRVAELTPSHPLQPVAAEANPMTPHSVETPPLMLANPLGGFSADGSEYIITTTAESCTPAPWVNVIANPDFGSVVTESGLAYSWRENAHEFRLTPWSDDPIGASGGESLYLRDEETGQYWSPTVQPCASPGRFQTRHGFGYSVFEHCTAEGIHSELTVYVDLEEPVKYSVLRVRNDSGRPRHLSTTGFVEWVLGDLRSKSALHVVTSIDPASGALFARNSYNTEFEGRVAFFDVDDMSRTITGDRTEFLGRNGSLSTPDAMQRTHLSGRVGAVLDPCGALQVSFALAAGEVREVIFRLGAGRDITHTSELARRLRIAGTASTALLRVREYWAHTLGAVQIDTPDEALNVLANGWLVYQTLACRLWARSGFYQSGGAFGFRDQLQDSMALVHAQPALLRDQLLLCAQRQYEQGDVQHWWHPPSGRGVRTRCSDDYLWLPLAACRYLQTTGDRGILDVTLNYLDGRALNPDEESYYDLPALSAQSASFYQHCVKAIEHGLRFGEHGLPLMGSGDWNDGMNLVGIDGRGESVWLGFFLFEVLTSFANVAEAHADPAFAERCREQAETLRKNLAQHAWDGLWYKRAWFDDGTPLGSSANAECSIDSISQSWSVLSGAGDSERSRKAMDALDKHLVNRQHGLVQLLDPPFDQSSLNPGYIKGYVPGVRENGGQYTHAAVWAAMAFAELGDSARAWELLALINPVNHTLTADAVTRYKTEPYAVAADVYAVAPHTGRGGWSWYTGSAGWLYRLIVESLMGLRRDSDRLFVHPCLPREWNKCSIRYRYGKTDYQISVTQLEDSGGIGTSESTTYTVWLDGVDVGDQGIPLLDDRLAHFIDVQAGVQ